jgi:CheY-like chemotaxis protein
MNKVLIVEDEGYLHDEWRRELNNKVVLISALSIREAEEQFTANSDISAIVMDACVPGDSPTTPHLVRKFRKTFAGPIIAISNFSEYRAKLVSAGCDHESRKDALPQKLLEVLGL